MSQLIFIISAGVFVVLGVLHGALTIRDDLGEPRAFTPADLEVRAGMQRSPLRFAPQTTIWRAWLGFNLSHSVGLVAFGGLLAGSAISDYDAIVRWQWPAAAACFVSVVYFALAVRYWFWVPAVCALLAAIGFVAAHVLG